MPAALPLPLAHVAADSRDTAPAVTSAAGLLSEAAALLARAASQLAASPPIIVAATVREEADRILSVEEAAAIARRSVSWMRKRGRGLPGYRQPGGAGTRVGWSRAALLAWASAPSDGVRP